MVLWEEGNIRRLHRLHLRRGGTGGRMRGWVPIMCLRTRLFAVVAQGRSDLIKRCTVAQPTPNSNLPHGISVLGVRKEVVKYIDFQACLPRYYLPAVG